MVQNITSIFLKNSLQNSHSIGGNSTGSSVPESDAVGILHVIKNFI